MDVVYPLEWFDDLIMTKLNHQKNDIVQIRQPHCEEIKERADLESLRIQSQIKSQVFATSSREEIEIVVRQYHSSLILLYDYALYQNHPVFSCSYLKNANTYVLSKIDDLISFIECRFSKYLSQEDLAPQSYLSRIQAEIKEKIPFLKVKLGKLTNDSKVIDIIINRLYRFSEGKKQPFNVTFKIIHYKKELVKNLCELDVDGQTELDYTALDKLLIYLNYNSKSYMKNLMCTIKRRINAAETVPDKIDQLLLSSKVFNQIFQKPIVKLNPKFDDIHQVMSNWFAQEIEYLEKSLSLSASPLKEEPIEVETSMTEPFHKNKVMCMLSTDQMALILRATDELRILQAKSMSKVFQTIVPHLSTPNRVNLSPDSMRSKSYTAEEKDKEIAIETLGRIVQRIQEY